MSETFCLALVSDTFGCNKALGAIELSSQYLSKDLRLYKQEWSTSILQKDMYAKYRDFNNKNESERYFEFVDIKCFRDYLVKLRLGLLPLNYSTFSSLFSRDTPDGCDYCGEFEDEKHLICFCPLYENIRVKYLNGLLTGPQCYNNLLRCNTIHTARNLGAFVFYAMRIRNHYDEKNDIGK